MPVNIDTLLFAVELHKIIASFKNGFGWRNKTFLDGKSTLTFDELLVKTDIEETAYDMENEDNAVHWLNTLCQLDEHVPF